MKNYQRVTTVQFRKDIKRLQKSGKNLQKLEKIITLLASDEHISSSYRDHPLKGNMRGARACHIEPDWLLVYAKDDDRLVLLLLTTGSHRRTLNIE